MEQTHKDGPGIVSAGEMWLDRTVSQGLLTALHDGPLRPLVMRRDHDRLLVDIQLRRASKDANHCWASLYVGLTTVLDVHEQASSFWLDAHATHRASRHFDPDWSIPRSLDALSKLWRAVEAYLNDAISHLDSHHTDLEGKVHAAMCSSLPEFLPGDQPGSVTFVQEPNRQEERDRRDRPAALGSRESHRIERAVVARCALSELAQAFRDEPGRARARRARAPARDGGETSRGTGGHHVGSRSGPLLCRAIRGAHSPSTERARTHPLDARSADRPRSHRARPNGTFNPPLIVPVLAIGAGVSSRQSIKRATMVQDAIDENVRSKPPVTKSEVWVLDGNGEPALVLR